MSEDNYKVVKRDVPGVGATVKKVFFADIIKGLSLTLGYNFVKNISMRYPDEEKWVPYKRFRGAHTLNRDENGKELCVACELCVKACPTDCITVVPEEDTTGRGIADRVPKVWEVNLVRCLFCGYCEEACPTTAVRLGRNYELACFNIEDTVKTRDDLLKPQEVPENFDGGIIVKAKYRSTKSGAKVRADLWNKKDDWWPTR